jgi:hypothetical protein
MHVGEMIIVDVFLGSGKENVLAQLVVVSVVPTRLCLVCFGDSHELHQQARELQEASIDTIWISKWRWLGNNIT